MKIYVKKVEGVALPEKGSPVAAGYDIVATSEPKIVGECETGGSRVDFVEYETNLFIAPSAASFHTLIHPRSSVSKYNLVLANSVGLVDNDYRGMVICRFKYIWQPEDYRLVTQGEGESLNEITRLIGVVNPNKIYKKGDKIAQLVVEPTVMADWELVDDLSSTQRGTGGFGSTDSKKGKPLVEVFQEEAKKFEAGRESGEASILKKYQEVGGIPTPPPYMERMKERLKN
jgi:dUTP pyrophosphatase